MVDVSKLKHEFKEAQERPVHSGRLLHVDGDFVAYFVSGGKGNTTDDMKHNADVILETLEHAAGAEGTVVHITAPCSTKGDRFKLAKLKKYQENRSGKAKPMYLEFVREYLRNNFCTETYGTLEADDGMAISQWEAIRHGNHDRSVIVSRDKDLRIVPGLHLDWDTHELVDVPFEGTVLTYRSKGATKIYGTGFKFFCAQLLTGDAVDNISGLPLIKINGKFKHCGPVAAVKRLEGLTRPADCLRAVALAYQEYQDEVGFKDYDGNPITAQEAMTSEAQLLWPRRSDNPNDVLNLFEEILSGKEVH